MLTKIRDGWWCDLSKVVDFNIYNEPELQFDMAYGHIIFDGTETSVRLMSKQACDDFEKVINLYILPSVRVDMSDYINKHQIKCREKGFANEDK